MPRVAIDEDPNANGEEVEPGAAYVDHAGDIRIFDKLPPNAAVPEDGIALAISPLTGIVGTLASVRVGDPVPEGWRRFHGRITLDFSED